MGIVKKVQEIFKQYGLVSIGILGFYFMMDKAETHTLCFFKGIFGIPCPGCGLTRAFLCLSKGDLEKAMCFHPLWFLPIVVFFVTIFKNNKYVGFVYKDTRFFLGLGILLLGVWGIRMVLFFPTIEPMNFNENALIPKIIRFIYFEF